MFIYDLLPKTLDPSRVAGSSWKRYFQSLSGDQLECKFWPLSDRRALSTFEIAKTYVHTSYLCMQ